MAKAKASKKSLNVLRKSVENKTSSAFKVNVKHVKQMAHRVIDAIKHAGDTVKAEILSWKGERPETLEALKEAIAIEGKAWLKDEKRTLNPQSVYNYISDAKAACNAFAKYAGMSDSKRKSFDKELAQHGNYIALIKFCRDTVRGRKSGKSDAENTSAAAKRLKSGWKNKPRDLMKKTKDMLRYAPTDNLLSLIDFAEAIIKARKQGNVERMRQAA